MATTFILWLVALGVGWIGLRSSIMEKHENLQAVGLIILVWGMFFFGILAIPNFISTPLNLYLDIAVTLVALSFSAIYFGYFKRVRKEFIISLVQEPDATRLKEIHVIVGPNDIRTTKARSCTISVSIPKRAESAEDIHFSIKQFHPETKESSNLFQLKNIPSTGNPVVTLRWKGTKEEFDSQIDRFATALNDSPEIRYDSLELPAGELPVPFIFCFTYPKSDVVYFPSVAARTYPLGQIHQVELWVRAKGRRGKKLKTLLIDARGGWDQVSLKEV